MNIPLTRTQALLAITVGLLQGCSPLHPPQPQTPPQAPRKSACAGQQLQKAAAVQSTVTPPRIQAGEKFTHQVVISVCDGSRIESGILIRRLSFNGLLLKEFPPEPQSIKSGTSRDRRLIGLPAGFEPGNYRLESIFEHPAGSVRSTVDVKVVAAAQR